ncbi:hypothetical protein [Jiulongibacter sediminis]|uniref:hypothetical protein n=1 Tax=Jiulongibacter sediminis TaxID=1605367 RepID=UPI0026F34D27|nr:hypothetical protein [Jiulongibacter sediminis]
MGITPQTVNNALKPYGLVYALVDKGIEVKWIINPGKSYDDSDFIYNGVSYKGGPFIITSPISSKADSIISAWTSQGVIVTPPTATSFYAPVYLSLKVAPNMVLDDKNGSIAENVLKRAGIMSSKYYFKDPQTLAACDDVFLIPHADPEWSTHSNLFSWNNTFKGAIWAGCHAVSAMENMFNPASPNEQTNFLSLKTSVASGSGPYAPSPGNSLILWDKHKDPKTPPVFARDFPAEPTMQYMGNPDAAFQSGSEQVFLPINGGGWRPETKVSVYDTDHEDIPLLSAGKAALVAFGQGFGDPNRGKVMYEGGHDIGGTSPANIAAQRMMINFVIWAGQDKAFILSTEDIPSVMVEGSSSTFNANISGFNAGPYTYTWESSNGGTFSNSSGTFANLGDVSSATQTSYTAPILTSDSLQTHIICQVTDACGRKVSESFLTVVRAIEPDTIPLTISPNTSDTLCPTADDIYNVESIDVDYCFGSLTMGTVTLDSMGCAIYTASDNVPGGEDRICVIGTDSLGRKDTTYFIITVPADLIQPDSILLTIQPNDADTLCPTADDIYSIDAIDIELCAGPMTMGSITTDSAGCAVYSAFDNAPGGTDTLCVIATDSLGRKDTTVFLITVPADLIQSDTILVTIQPNDADTLCPTADDIYGIDTIDIELCAGPMTMGSISTDSAGCAIYSAFDNAPGGTDTLCVIATDSLGRKDTTVFLVTVPADLIQPDTILVTIQPNDADTLCPTADDIYGIDTIDIELCGGPLTMGSISTDSAGCAVYSAFDNAPGGADTLCVVATDSLGRKDTTVFLITVPADIIQPDTILVTIQPNDADTLCPTADDIYGIDAIDIELCAGPMTMGSISTDSAGCAIYSAFNNAPGGTDTLCVIATDSLGRKDTTVFLITVPADIIHPDTILVTIYPHKTDTLCPTADDIYGIDVIDVELCAGPMTMGNLSLDAAGCAVYYALDNSTGGTDTLCVIATDSLGRKDTTVFLITISQSFCNLGFCIPLSIVKTK